MTAQSFVSWRRQWLLAGALLLAGLMPAPSARVEAATFNELYTVSVRRDPAAGDNRADAMRRGMAILLTRITGRQPADHPEMAGLIANADSYNVSYASVSSTEVRIGFQRTAVNDELVRLNLPIWPDERPATLIWLAADFGGGLRAELQSRDDGSGRRGGALTGTASEPLPEAEAALFDEWADAILAAADERGLPVVLPRLDAEDRLQVRFADVWGGFDRFVVRAAERYGVDGILIGRVAMTDFGPEISWTLLRGAQRQNRVTQDPRAGIDWIADQYASESAIVGGARLTWITIQRIAAWPDFLRVLESLDSLSIVEQVDPESLSASGDMLVRITVRGADQELRQVLALEGDFVSPETLNPGAVPAANGSRELVFVPSWLATGGAFDPL